MSGGEPSREAMEAAQRIAHEWQARGGAQLSFMDLIALAIDDAFAAEAVRLKHEADLKLTSDPGWKASFALMNDLAALRESHADLLARLREKHHEFTHDYERDEARCSDCQLIARAKALQPGDWQDIATAPKDGTSILVHDNDAPGLAGGVADQCWAGNTAVAGWWTDDDGSNGHWVCDMNMVQDPECHFEPTHWQPLPPPPETTR